MIAGPDYSRGDGLKWSACPTQPVALVLLPWTRAGTTIALQDVDGQLYGCRDVSAGPSHDEIVAAWIDTQATQKGLAVDDRRV